MSGRPPLIAMTLTIEARVGEDVVEANIGYLPWLLGEHLATQVADYAEAEGLGYFPAVDFFRGRPEAVDPALLMLLDQVARFCADFTRRECRRRLRGLFATIEADSEQALAYAMPPVRPRRGDARQQLAAHFSPDRVRLQLAVQGRCDPAAPGFPAEQLHEVVTRCADLFPSFAAVDLRPR